ncbi:MAG TPA: hypothetical protein VJQ83_05325 [Tepidiformaceae bacterium]|nr:hypothetical protein [Tepidiformaceae bacterium]
MTRKERHRWFMALIVAFALGFLLACYLLPHQVLRASCPRPDDHGPLLSMNGSTSGHGSEGRGSPEKIGSPGEGTGHHTGRPNAAPVEGGGGARGSGGGGDGDLGGGKQWQAHGEEQTFDGKSGPSDKAPVGDGDGSGEAKDGTGGEATQSPSQQARATRTDGPGSLHKESGGAVDTGTLPPAAGSSMSSPAANVVVAPDLRYDTSDLPRYPNAVTKVGSGTALPKGAPAADPNMSVSAILTSDDPQAVAAWYHAHLPQDWTQMNLGGLTVFWPPDRKADPRTVWIILDDKTNQTAALLWKPKKKPAP